MFRWNLMLRTLFGLRYDQAKARRPKETAKPRLEWLEDRTMPSVLGPNSSGFEVVVSPPPVPSVATLASPAPAPSVAAFTSYVFATMDHWFQFMATAEQEFLGDLTLVTQEFAQLESPVRQQVGRFLGNNSNAANPALNPTVTQPGNDIGMGRGNSSGSGSGKGAMTTANNAPNQPINQPTQQTGSGSGSGSISATNHPIAPAHGGMVHPLTSSGTGSGSSGSGVSGSGTGSVGGGGSGSGYGSVSGKLWLDNDGDGSWDDGELGYSGATIELMSASMQPYSVAAVTTTGSDGKYVFPPIPTSPQPQPFFVHVVDPGDFTDTFFGSSQINNALNSSIFLLGNGGWRAIRAGLLAMNVTTTQDDPNAPIQNQITLRDAIKTGNNGGGPLKLNQISFYDSQKQQPLSGTITLQKALDPIKGSYNIYYPPGATTLAVSGANSFNVFTVQATSTISNLTIENGYAASGGGVFNSGTLTLSNDKVVNNSTPNGGNGGGIFNTKGKLNLKSTDVNNNTATQNGGGLNNVGGGQVTISAREFYNNRATNGGGIFNNGGGGKGATLTIANNTVIDYNIVTGAGGGLYNTSGQVMMTGGSIYENSSGAGGGIYTVGGNVSLTYVYLYSNFAKTGDGGGIRANGNVTLKGGTVQGNTAKNGQGGGIYLIVNTLTLAAGGSGDVIIGGGNTAKTGGGLYLATGKTNFSGVTVSGNTATVKAAGIAYTTKATLNPRPPIPAADLTDPDDPGGQPVLV